MMRGTIIPRTIGGLPGVHAYVGGTTAGSHDFNATMKPHLPLVFTFVLGLPFVQLLVSFRSMVIPLKTIVLNLVSVGSAYGVVRSSSSRAICAGRWGAQDVGRVVDCCRCSCSWSFSASRRPAS